MSLHDERLKEAAGVVHASVSARLRDHPDDAQLVIHHFIVESMAKGMPEGDCWMLLFSAAVGRYSDTLVALARAQHIDPEVALGRAALYTAST